MTQKTPAEQRADAEKDLEPLGKRRLRLQAQLDDLDQELRPVILSARSVEVSLRRIQALTGVAPNTVRAWERAAK